MEDPQWLEWLKNFGVISFIASAASSFLKSNSKNTAVQLILDFIALLAVNIGKAENKDDGR